MKSLTDRAAVWSCALRRRHAARAAAGDAGFILLESIVAMTIVTIVVAALGVFFVGATHQSGEQRENQSATVVADNAIDQIRAIPKPSDLYSGRTSGAVAQQFSNAPTQVQPWLTRTDMYPVSNDTTNATVIVPATLPAVTTNGTVFTPTDYIGSCAVPVDPANGTACLSACPSTTPAATGTCTAGYSGVATAPYLRVVVAVTWADSSCPSNTCAYVTSTLLTANATDPDFLLQTQPPSAPVVLQTAAQSNAVNDTVSLQLNLKANTGINPNQWTVTGLPAGLQADAFSGLITGTPTTATSASGQTVTVYATDAFGRQSNTMTFTWTILPDLTTDAPANVSGTQYSVQTPLVITASGGSGATYTWASTTGLPPGLTLATTTTTKATISGTPTSGGTFTSTTTVADSSGRTRTMTIYWTIAPRASVTGFTSSKVLAGWRAASPMSYNCPAGFATCTYVATGAPAGAFLATSATATSATPADGSVVVTPGSGTIYLISPSVPSTGSPWTIVVKGSATGTTTYGPSVSATWTLATGSSLLVDQSATKSGAGTVSNQVSAACATSTCAVAFTLNAQSAAWLSATQTGTLATSLQITTTTTSFWVRGTIPTTAGTYPAVVTITDTNGNTLTETATYTRASS